MVAGQSTEDPFKQIRPMFGHFERLPNSAQILHQNPKKRLDSLIRYQTGNDPDGYDLKFTYEYDDNGNLIKFIAYKKTTPAEWLLWLGDEWKYNDNNQMIKESCFLMLRSPESIRKYSERTEYTYKNGRIVERLVSDSNQKIKNMSSDQKEYYFYDSNGNMVEKKLYRLMNEAWDFPTRSTYHYNTNGLLTKHGDCIFEDGDCGIKMEFFYDSNNDLIQVIHKKYRRFDLTYQTKGILKNMEEFRYNETSWEPYRKTEYLLDSLANRTETKISKWDPITQDWKLDDHTFYEYDNNYPYTELLTSLDEGECRHQLLTSHSRDFSSEMEIQYKSVYFWSEL